MTTAQILRLPARIGARPYPAPAVPMPEHETRCAKLRLERDEALESARYWEAQAHEAQVELDAVRAHRERAPWGPVILSVIVGAMLVIGLHWRFG